MPKSPYTKRLRRLAWVSLLGIFLALILSAIRDEQRQGLLYRGDFPAFYSAGRLVAEGKAENLYEQIAQREIQNASWPSLNGSYYAFTYPPFVALFFVPISKFSPLAAKLLVTFLMLGFLLGAVCIWAGIDPRLREHSFFACMYMLSLAPVFSGVFSGQNAALSLFLLAAATRLLLYRSAGTAFFAGILNGLWMFKPQLGALFFLLALPYGRKPFFWGFAAASLVLYGLGVTVIGIDWPLRWLQAVQEFSGTEYSVNIFQLVSLSDRLYVLASGRLDGTWTYIEAGILVLVALLLAMGLRSARSSILSYDERLLPFFGLLIVLFAPHVLFYELGLVVLPVLPALLKEKEGGAWKLLLLFLLISALTVLRGYGALSFIPLLVAVLAHWALSVAAPGRYGKAEKII